jgi:hypothetical protein
MRRRSAPRRCLGTYAHQLASSGLRPARCPEGSPLRGWAAHLEFRTEPQGEVIQRNLPIRGLHDVVPDLLESTGQTVANAIVVVDQQHRRATRNRPIVLKCPGLFTSHGPISPLVLRTHHLWPRSSTSDRLTRVMPWPVSSQTYSGSALQEVCSRYHALGTSAGYLPKSPGHTWATGLRRARRRSGRIAGMLMGRFPPKPPCRRRTVDPAFAPASLGVPSVVPGSKAMTESLVVAGHSSLPWKLRSGEVPEFGQGLGSINFESDVSRVESALL